MLYIKPKAVKRMSGWQKIRTPIVRVLIKIRVAVSFYPQFIPIAMTFMGRAECLTVIILPHLTGGWHF